VARVVNGRRSGGVHGVPRRGGGRRNRADSAATNRIAAIANGCASGGRRLPRRPPRQRARVSAQRRFRKDFPVLVRDATSCFFLRGVALTSDSVRACAARLCGAFCSAKRDGGGDANGGCPADGESRPGGRKYVAAYGRPLACGLSLFRCRGFGGSNSPSRWLSGSREAGEDR
jgi:hypothetical protein